jgi:hypothetical protein
MTPSQAAFLFETTAYLIETPLGFLKKPIYNY